eukprot:scaffold24140_cov51-Phaeocystis_antarctica.AAC.2
MSRALAQMEPPKPVALAAATRCGRVGSASPEIASRTTGYRPLVRVRVRVRVRVWVGVRVGVRAGIRARVRARVRARARVRVRDKIRANLGAA